MGRYTLVVKEGKDTGRVVHLRGPIITLGRPGAEGASTVEFEEPTVSRVHAILKWREDQGCYELSNRSFTNPARINGEPATSGALLLHGCRLQLGELVAQVRDNQEEQPESSPFMGCLELIHGPGYPGTRYPLYREKIQIGRSGECEIQLPSAALSQFHARIEWYEKLPVLMPQSHRPIFVNGQPIGQGTFLQGNDFILLGTGVALRWLPVSVLAKEERRPPPTEAPPQSPAARPPPDEEEEASEEMVVPEPERSPASTSGRAAFFADLAGRLDRGEPIRQAVEEAALKSLPALATRLSDGILAGHGLSETLARFSDRFTSYELGMVAAGEEAGILEGQLQALAASLEEDRRCRRLLARGLWLALPLLASGLPLLLLRPMLDLGPLAYAAGLTAALTVTALEGLMLWATLSGLRRSSTWRRLVDGVVDRLPLLGQALRLRTGARFLQALGPLLGSGMQAHRAALLAAGCTGSTTHTVVLMEAARRMEQGDQVLDSLAPTGLLGPEVLVEVEKGEEHGDLPERLATASARLQEASRAALDRAFPVLLAGPALLVALLALANSGLVLLFSGD